jgi:hypothetical protein
VCDRSAWLQIPAKILLALERLEQRLEVSGPEALRTLSLDDLVKERRAILHRLREDLKQIPFFVAIDENTQVAQRRQILIDLPDTLRNGVVVRAGNTQEFDAVASQPGDRFDDVVGCDRDVLTARSLIKLEILVDL